MAIDFEKEGWTAQAAEPEVRQYLSASESSGDDTIDALVAGGDYKWGPSGFMGQSTTVTYSFLTSAPSYNPVSSFQEFNDTMKSAARLAFAEWSSVANITFVEVPSWMVPPVTPISRRPANSAATSGSPTTSTTTPRPRSGTTAISR